MLWYIVSFCLGAFVGCAAAIWWFRSVFRDPTKLMQFLGLSGIDLKTMLKTLGLDHEGEDKEDGL